jgi:hypothetical protein
MNDNFIYLFYIVGFEMMFLHVCVINYKTINYLIYFHPNIPAPVRLPPLYILHEAHITPPWLGLHPAGWAAAAPFGCV